MYTMYVDESGDQGLHNSPTSNFILSGFVVHELRWQDTLDRLIDFRRRMQERYGLRVREEIHAAHFITRPGSLIRIQRHNRLAILRAFADEIAAAPDVSIINVVVQKAGKAPTYDVFGMAWKTLIQRFENTMSHRNFPGPANPDERGMLFPDQTDVRRLTQLTRQMRRYNPIPNQPTFGLGYRNLRITRLIEDPSFRDSAHSYFVQVADLAAYLLYQRLEPNAYFRKKSASNYFNRLRPVLCKVAARNEPDGIVFL